MASATFSPDTVGGLWTNASNAIASDDTYAQDNVSAFGFSNNLIPDYVVSIPSGSTVDGVEVTIHRKAAASGVIYDYIVTLEIATIGTSDNKADIITSWPTTEGTATYGGPSDLWGYVSIPEADIETSAQVSISVQNMDSSAHIAYVDYVEMKVYYTTSGGGAAVKVFHLRQQEMD